jgi:hypothetical protein
MLLKDPDTGLLLRRLAYGNLLANSRYCCCGYPYGGSGSGSGIDGDDFECECCACARYFFTVTGVSCVAANQTYLMPLVGLCGNWTGITGGISASLTVVDGTSPCGTYRLFIGPLAIGASTATYEMAAEEWDCDGCNIMTLSIVTGTCTGWPTTVNVCCG